MKLDLGSFAFGSEVLGGGNTPSWGTSLGQIKPELKLTSPGYDNIVIGMANNAIPADKVFIPLGRGGHVCNSIEDDGILIAALFDKVYVNEIRVNSSFILIMYKEKSESWDGRKTLKYNIRTEYRRGKDDIVYNYDFVGATQETLGLAKNACWLVSDLYIVNQDELHMVVGIVNPEHSETYKTPQERKVAFLSAINTTYDENPQFKLKYSPETLSKISQRPTTSFTDSSSKSYITALRTKPFLLLAGISGTGKSRIVRKLAQASVTEDLQREYDPKSVENGFDRWNLHKPANFELVQVKPNWHNSLEVVGYKSNVNGAHYEFTPFVEFVARAWKHQDIPFFLCLDEMNLAPVEQYFAEFLSAIESRSFENDEYETDPIVKSFNEFGEDVCKMMLNHLVGKVDASNVNPDSLEAKLIERFRTKGLTLPKNLLVMGTVNMDETTFSFSRKVLDRAMSILMNEVDYENFFNGTTENDVPEISDDVKELLVNRPIKGLDAENNHADEVKDYLDAVNAVLKDTPFMLGYRAANEALLYVSAANALGTGSDVNELLDEFTLMKILSRIEGDKRSVGDKLEKLQSVIDDKYPKSSKKLAEMKETLNNKQFVSYWI